MKAVVFYTESTLTTRKNKENCISFDIKGQKVTVVYAL